MLSGDIRNMTSELNIKVGFIGAGRMAQALSKGFINAGKSSRSI